MRSRSRSRNRGEGFVRGQGRQEPRKAMLRKEKKLARKKVEDNYWMKGSRPSWGTSTSCGRLLTLTSVGGALGTPQPPAIQPPSLSCPAD